ncbi:DUF6515 family protein [uncultured Pseudomonas sp.]|uniref:DUF6515 family protein n=1 Tax=uncultured Pseudomonas sp. TaxID=114707 RepID=UPI00260056EF|nr:DUF6515 family protein [uncultured Pseudomonas sp.]
MKAPAVLFALALLGVATGSAAPAWADSNYRLGGGYVTPPPGAAPPPAPAGNGGGWQGGGPGNWNGAPPPGRGGGPGRGDAPPPERWGRPDPGPRPDVQPAFQDRPVPLPRPGYMMPAPAQPDWNPPRPPRPNPGYDQGWSGNRPGWGAHPQWRPGFEVPGIPAGFTRVWYRDSQYYYADGYWYRPQGPRYVVTLPPTGVRVSVLPAFAETLWMGGTTYYFAAGSYYRTDPGGGFVTVADPTVAAVPATSAAPTGAGYDAYDVTAYPLQGQPPERYATDRYDCRRYAAGDSGFDPERPGAVADPYLTQRFRQALAACLAGRGYRVE